MNDNPTPSNSEQASKSPVRWALFAPAGIAAYLIIIVIGTITFMASSSMPSYKDPKLLFLNTAAACVSCFVATAIAPKHRTVVGIGWVIALFGVACWGNLINGAHVVPFEIASMNIFLISLGGIGGCFLCRAVKGAKW